jgi:hypothetical protein
MKIFQKISESNPAEVDHTRWYGMVLIFQQTMRRTMNWFLFAAAVVSLITFLAHLFWGGREVVKPLLDTSDLQEIPKLTMYYCWHIVTLLLFGTSCVYVYLSLFQFDIPLTIAITSIAAACALLSLGLIVIRRLRPLDYPQWVFFIPITLLGVLSLFSS